MRTSISARERQGQDGRHQLKQRYNLLKSQNCCFPDENGQSNCTIHDGEPVMQQRFVVVVIDLAAAVVTVVARSGDILE